MEELPGNAHDGAQAKSFLEMRIVHAPQCACLVCARKFASEAARRLVSAARARRWAACRVRSATTGAGRVVSRRRPRGNGADEQGRGAGRSAKGPRQGLGDVEGKWKDYARGASRSTIPRGGRERRRGLRNHRCHARVGPCGLPRSLPGPWRTLTVLLCMQAALHSAPPLSTKQHQWQEQEDEDKEKQR